MSDGENNQEVLSDNENPLSETERVDDIDNEDDTARRIDPATSKKRIIRNPQPKLNAERLRGPKGIQTIEEYFNGFKWHGKGHEASDLNKVMKRLEHWGHRLFPKYNYDDFLEKVAALGSKKEVQVFLTKYRRDMITEDIRNPASDDEDDVIEREKSPEPVDEFDLLIAEQIEKTKQSMTPLADKDNSLFQENLGSQALNKTFNKPAALHVNEDMKKKIERNRQLALEKKMAKMKAMKETEIDEQMETNPSDVTFEIPIQEEIIPNNQVLNNSSQNNDTVVGQIENVTEIDSQIETDHSDVSFEIPIQKEIIFNKQVLDDSSQNDDTVADQIEKGEHPACKTITSSIENNVTEIKKKQEHNLETHTTSLGIDSINIKNNLDDTIMEVSSRKSKGTESSNISGFENSQKNPGKRLLTSEELDKEIDDAVNQFMNRKRKSK